MNYAWILICTRRLYARAEKITELYNYCNIHGCCEVCKLEDLSLGCNFQEMADTTINALYEEIEKYVIDGTLHMLNNLANVKKLKGTEEGIWRD